MKYDDYLLKILKGDCPFCDIKDEYILEKWKYFTVIVARAPYFHDHLLVVPNRHLIRLWEMTSEESKSLILMIEKWTKKLEEIHTEVNILLRDGVANWISWKSVDHLHFHLIPDCQVYSSNSWWDRKIYSDNALAKEVQDLKNRLNMK